MKKFIVILLLSVLSSTLYAQDDKSTLILKEIQNLRLDMNKRFEQVDKRFEQVDKRFEQVDKRFEQVDKQIEQVNQQLKFIQSLVYLLMGIVFASPFIAIYLKDKKDIEDRKVFDQIKGVIFVLREIAQDDERLSKALKAANI